MATSRFFLLFLPFLFHDALSSTPPWQSTSSNVKEEVQFKDLPHTSFSSTGRLLGVELMLKDVLDSETTNFAIGLTFEDGVVVFSSSHKSPYLDLDEDDCDGGGGGGAKFPLVPPSERSFRVGPRLYSAEAGEAIDSQLIRDAVLQISTSLWEDRDGGFGIKSQVSAALLARNLADSLHRMTQSEKAGTLLSAFTLVFDPKTLWRVDPTGQFWKCQASAIGRHSQEMETWLVEHLRERDSLSENDSVQLLKHCIQEIFPNERRISGVVVSSKGHKQIRFKD